MMKTNNAQETPGGEAGFAMDYQAVMEQLPCGIIRCRMDHDLTLTYFNEGFAHMTGYTREQILHAFHNSLRALVHPDDFAIVEKEAAQQLADSNYKTIEYRIIRKDGASIWVMDKGCLIDCPDGTREYFCILMDISESKQNMQQLLQRAQRDPLTGLYNRGTVKMLVEDYLRKTKGRTQAALVMLDLDNFKLVNDIHGHLVADTLLIDIAGAIRQDIRSTDYAGRMGGDEMMLFLCDIPDIAFVKRKVNQLLNDIHAVARERIGENCLTCSAGIAIHPHNGKDFTALYRSADQALYRAKSEGKARWHLAGGDTSEAMGGEAPALSEHVQPGTGLVEYAFQMLYEAEKLPAAIDCLLALIGRRLDISRAYIFENSADGTYLVNTFEWCAAGVEPQKENLQHVPKSLLFGYYELVEETDGLFYCRDIEKLPQSLRDILVPQNIKSMLHYSLLDNGVYFGMIGFDECRAQRYWSAEQIDLIRSLSRVVETFLARYRKQERETPAGKEAG